MISTLDEAGAEKKRTEYQQSHCLEADPVVRFSYFNQIPYGNEMVIPEGKQAGVTVECHDLGDTNYPKLGFKYHEKKDDWKIQGEVPSK